MSNMRVDFKANLKFLSSEEGGRKTPAYSGYRPHIEFEGYQEYLTSGSQNYVEKDVVYPGENVVAEITIVSVDYFSKKIYFGQKFKFFEGSRTIGYGEIIEIVNEKLKSK